MVKLNLCIINNRREDIHNINASVSMFLSEFPESKAYCYYDDKLTDEIKEEFLENDNFIVIDGKKNKGMLAARAAIVKKVPKSEYIIWLDSDDSLLIHNIKNLLSEVNIEDYDIVGDCGRKELWSEIWKSDILKQAYDYFSKLDNFYFDISFGEASVPLYIINSGIVKAKILDTKKKYELVNYKGYHGIPTISFDRFWYDSNVKRLADLIAQLLILEITKSPFREFFGLSVERLLELVKKAHHLANLYDVFKEKTLPLCDKKYKNELEKRFEKLAEKRKIDLFIQGAF